MRPTSRELLESIRWALDERVAPAVADPWAASTLRSVRTLLDHLMVRVECEHELAAAARDDLQGTLREVRALLDGSCSGVWSVLRAELDAALDADRAAPDPPEAVREGEEPDLEDLCDRLLRALRREPEGIPERVGDELHARLKAFVARQLERERPLFLPAFTGKLF